MAAGLLSVAAALLSSLGAFLFGLDIGYIAPILEHAEFKRDVAHLPDWENPDSKIAAGEAGFIVAIFSIGAIIMSLPLVSSYFLDSFGRRMSIIIGSLIFLVGCAFQARALSLPVMFVGRFVNGCSIGLLSNVVPLYQSEMAPPKLRGALTSTYQLMITLGIFVAAFLDLELLQFQGGWRTAIWLQMIPAIVILVTMPLLPCSPHWLVQKGRNKEAQVVLARLRGEEEAGKEYEGIVKDFDASLELGEPMWREVFTGRVGKLVALGSTLQLLQQLVGMNAFMYFGPRIFGSFGVPETLFQTINNSVNCLATLPALYLIDCAGRKFLFIAGAIGMMCSCLLMGALGEIFIHKNAEGALESTSTVVSSTLVGCVFFFVVSFACTWGPITWVYCSEIFPLKYRSRCIGVTTATNWVGNFLIAQFAPMFLDSIGFGTFFIFAFFGLCALLVGLWLPETKGLMLEDIGGIFDKRFGKEEHEAPEKTANP
jgi:sugar porter (SP) family MFS transporter